MIPRVSIVFPTMKTAAATGLAISRKVRLQTVAIAALFAITLAFLVPKAPLGYLAWSGLMVALLIALSIFDAETLTVPDALTFPLIATGMLHAVLNLPNPTMFIVAPAGLLAAGWLVGRWAGETHFSWLGGGDILLVAGALAWLGPYVFADYLLLGGALVFGAAALQFLSGRPEPYVALAPASSLAQIAIWFSGPIL